MLLRNLNKIFWPPIYLRVNTSNPRLQQPSTTRWDNLVLKISFKNLIQILQKSVHLQSPLGPLWARFPYKFLRNLNIKLGRIFLPSILQLLLLGQPPPVTLLWRSAYTVPTPPSKGSKIKFKRVPILKELPDLVMQTPVTILIL